jgi:hypothetical protein
MCLRCVMRQQANQTIKLFMSVMSEQDKPRFGRIGIQFQSRAGPGSVSLRMRFVAALENNCSHRPGQAAAELGALGITSH